MDLISIFLIAAVLAFGIKYFIDNKKSDQNAGQQNGSRNKNLFGKVAFVGLVITVIYQIGFVTGIYGILTTGERLYEGFSFIIFIFWSLFFVFYGIFRFKSHRLQGTLILLIGLFMCLNVIIFVYRGIEENKSRGYFIPPFYMTKTEQLHMIEECKEESSFLGKIFGDNDAINMCLEEKYDDWEYDFDDKNSQAKSSCGNNYGYSTPEYDYCICENNYDLGSTNFQECFGRDSSYYKNKMVK